MASRITRAKTLLPIVTGFALSVAILSRIGYADQAAMGLVVPDGFAVTPFADDPLAHDVFSLTFDPAGRLVVSGPGYIRTLLDRDGDGRAETAVDLNHPLRSGAQGMCFIGSRLLATGDRGLWCWTDADGDAQADGPPEKWLDLNLGEHGAHAIRQGPDGWIYVMCGNDAGVTGRLIQSDSSPIKNPESGCLLRISPDGRQRQCLADGFRNPYDFDFHPSGAILTVDSDGERDQHLPWYVPTRLLDIGRGAHHGWISQGWTQSWSRPGYFLDSVQPLATFGRGSPTGLVVYRHHAFPEKYRHAVFTACWSLGRIYAVFLTPAGDTFRARSELFLSAQGDSGFAPVDIQVGPAGDLWVAIGGRGTQGGIYRIWYPASDSTATAPPATAQRTAIPASDGDPSTDRLSHHIDQVLGAPQPLTAWSRAQWSPLVGALPRPALVAAAADPQRATIERLRAVEILVELGGLAPAEVDQITGDGNARVAARCAWALADSINFGSTLRLAQWTRHADPWVARAAYEALVGRSVQRGLVATQRHPLRYRRVRQAQLRAPATLETLVTSRVATERLAPIDAAWRRWAPQLRRRQTDPDASAADPLLELAAEFALHRGPDGRWAQLEILRLLQLAVGDIQVDSERPDQAVGYSAQNLWLPVDQRRQIAEHLLRAFPTGDDPVDWEIGRTLAILRAPEIEGQIEAVASWTSQKEEPETLLHGLMVLSQLPGPRSAQVTRQIAAAIARIHPAMDQRDYAPSRNWTPRARQTVSELSRQDPQLGAALVEQPEFRLAAQAVFIDALPPDLQPQATRRLMESTPDAHEWSAELIRQVAELPDGEGIEWLRTLWDQQIQRDLAAALLAQSAHQDDRLRLLASLGSADPEVVRQCAQALADMPPPSDWQALLPLWQSVQRFAAGPGDEPAALSLQTLCQNWFDLPADEFPDLASLTDQLMLQFPQLADLAPAPGRENWDQWQLRLASIDWSQGRRKSGQQLFERLACHTCHSAQGRLGPQLTGITQRLSVEDLFRSIVLPQDQVSPAYQLVRVETEGGKVYHGMPVYESPDATLLQVGSQQVIRIAGERIVSFESSDRSLMPTGLLDPLDDRQLADLYAYLQELK